RRTIGDRQLSKCPDGAFPSLYLLHPNPHRRETRRHACAWPPQQAESRKRTMSLSLPKFSKDQIKKLVLSAMGFVFLLYVYFTFFLGPLQKARTDKLAQIADRQQKIDSSKSEVQKAANLERQAKDAMARFAALKGLAPEGPP